jgi:hypothetical protein
VAVRVEGADLNGSLELELTRLVDAVEGAEDTDEAEEEVALATVAEEEEESEELFGRGEMTMGSVTLR